MLPLLIRGGAKVNTQDDFGCTPLHDAARVSASENIARLLKAGASASIADVFGVTPARLAHDRDGDTAVAELRAAESPVAKPARNR